MNTVRLGYFFFIMSLWIPLYSVAQPDTARVVDGSDPALIQSRIMLNIESDIYYQPAQFYSIGFGYFYALQNKRHMMGFVVPFVHSVFNKDLQGFENTVGIGDIRMLYMGAFIFKETTGLTRISPYFEVTAPTGSYLLGRGAGTWQYKPGVILTYALHPNVSAYPQVEFQFSGSDANSLAGGNGNPDLQDNAKDGRLQNLNMELPVILRLESVHAWLSLKPQYIQSFNEREYFIFFVTEAGKMIGDKTAAKLSISKFVAGLPRINVVFQARIQFFF